MRLQVIVITYVGDRIQGDSSDSRRDSRLLHHSSTTNSFSTNPSICSRAGGGSQTLLHSSPVNAPAGPPTAPAPLQYREPAGHLWALMVVPICSTTLCQWRPHLAHGHEQFLRRCSYRYYRLGRFCMQKWPTIYRAGGPRVVGIKDGCLKTRALVQLFQQTRGPVIYYVRFLCSWSISVYCSLSLSK